MKTKQITLQIPTITFNINPTISRITSNFRFIKQGLKLKFNIFFLNIKNFFSKFSTLVRPRTEFKSEQDFRQRTFPKNIKLKKILFYIFGIVILFMILTILTRIKTNPSSSENQVSVKDAISTVDLNKEFNFPLKDEKGEKVGEIKYIIEKAEIRDEIIVNGKKATSVKGREFLILLLKVSNSYSKSIEINTRDYVRLSVNGNKDEWLAPDIHNDPVEVQAISTKNTRVGFPINSSDKNMILKVGEINGDKEEVELNF